MQYSCFIELKIQCNRHAIFKIKCPQIPIIIAGLTGICTKLLYQEVYRDCVLVISSLFFWLTCFHNWKETDRSINEYLIKEDTNETVLLFRVSPAFLSKMFCTHFAKICPPRRIRRFHLSWQTKVCNFTNHVFIHQYIPRSKVLVREENWTVRSTMNLSRQKAKYH